MKKGAKAISDGQEGGDKVFISLEVSAVSGTISQGG